MGQKRFRKAAPLPNPFFNAWHDLAAAGACDAYGSVECARVYGEWLAAGSPKPIGRFIRQRANVGSAGTHPRQEDGPDEVTRGTDGA